MDPLLREKLSQLTGRLNELTKLLELDKKKKEVVGIETLMSEPNFWSRQDSSDKISSLKSLKKAIDVLTQAQTHAEELAELGEIAGADEMEREIIVLEKSVAELEFASLLGGRQDIRPAIISIHAGAGGTESCDWAAMLYRMYSRWADRKGFKIREIDFLAGEEAGIKSVSAIITGDYAYGYLKSERGVHRLVRISPFDANKRRHTSFASVDVIPEVSEDIKIDIKEDDLRIDTYRAGGKGGQHVNMTDSAVRITHTPTGIVVQCQNERSQYQNKEVAMKMLRGKLYEVEEQKREAEMARHHGSKKKIEWGSQIRSYVLHPYNMVKDHRTSVETSNTGAVLDGDIGIFSEAYLRWYLQ